MFIDVSNKSAVSVFKVEVAEELNLRVLGRKSKSIVTYVLPSVTTDVINFISEYHKFQSRRPSSGTKNIYI